MASENERDMAIIRGCDSLLALMGEHAEFAEGRVAVARLRTVAAEAIRKRSAAAEAGAADGREFITPRPPRRHYQ